jgi:hypothetical protein
VVMVVGSTARAALRRGDRRGAGGSRPSLAESCSDGCSRAGPVQRSESGPPAGYLVGGGDWGVRRE